MKLVIRLLPFFILTTLVVFFFLPLFWPVSQIYISPDSHLSDILHFHYPMKFLLSESLKTNQLPLWTDLIGTGFFPIGEGQIQALSLINCILFKFFPLITAFNLQYVIVFLGFSIGMYVITQEFGWSKLTGLYCAIIFTFSGLHIVKIPHLNCLQALSYVPFIFWIFLRMQKNKHTKLWLFLPFLFSQQILQGHYQYVFLTYIFLLAYFYLSWWKTQKEDHPWLIKKIFVIGCITLGLSAGQLIPTLEYFIQSGSRMGVQDSVTGTFQFRHLIQFFSPFVLGDGRIGTYPAPTYGIAFLETFSYIGVVPILLALSSLWFIRKNKWIQTCWVIIALLFLFVFEKNSPIYFLFSLPPFSWFRVYSRFLAFITFLLVLLSGYMFNKIFRGATQEQYKKNIPKHDRGTFGSSYFLIFFIFFVSIFDVLMFASSYQPLLPTKNVFTLPELYQNISSEYRMTTIPNNNKQWLSYMYTYGWKNPNDYLYLLQGGQPNYTLLYSLSNMTIYAGFLPKKQQQLIYLALETSTWDDKEKTASLSALAMNTLKLHNTKHLITASKVTNPEVKLIKQTNPSKNNLEPLFLYELSHVKPKYLLTSTYKKVSYVDEYIQEAKKTDVLLSYDAFITTDRELTPIKELGTLSILSESNTKKVFSISNPSDTFFVASIYLYPGWIAYLDGKKTDLYPANISGMAVFIPKGTHTLVLQFIPISLYMGLSIGGVALLLYGFIIIRFFHRASP